ncbi:MAG: hypothetical protein CMJ49_12805 [Planctomycetaceae bacterium]|nr:hypothetical protein [Planctomycetaceae bacterium]
MTTPQLIMWFAIGALGLIGSALFSGLETGIYTLNRIRLHVLAHAGQPNATVLQRLIHHPNRLLGTLLFGNNIANYMASVAITALLADAGRTDAQIVVINAVILTPLLFVFGEVLPKDLFRSHTDTATYPFARPLFVTQRLLTWTGLLPLVDGFTALLNRIIGTRAGFGRTLHPRRVVTELFRESAGQGLISDYQSDMIDRVLQHTHMRVADVMIPWNQVVTLRTGQPLQSITDLAARVTHSRIPALDAHGTFQGVVDVIDALLKDADPAIPIDSLIQPVPTIQHDHPLPDALDTLQQKQAPMAIVMRDHHPAGLVTLKDLVEPIIGDIEIW